MVDIMAMIIEYDPYDLHNHEKEQNTSHNYIHAEYTQRDNVFK